MKVQVYVYTHIHIHTYIYMYREKGDDVKGCVIAEDKCGNTKILDVVCNPFDKVVIVGLFQCHQRPTIVSKETYYMQPLRQGNNCRSLLLLC